MFAHQFLDSEVQVYLKERKGRGEKADSGRLPGPFLEKIMKAKGFY
jgi:hypothetical protein